MPRWTGPRKYDPLSNYLAQQSADSVTLTLDAIEAMLGAPLPATARATAFWTNYERNPPSRAWRRVGWRVARQPGHRWMEAVTFVRVASEPPGSSQRLRPRQVQPAAVSPKYRPFTDFLRGVAADQITLTLPEIEQIIGHPLPRTARARGWWVNASRARHARAWLRAGWQVCGSALDEGPAAVTFSRGPADSPV